ncbi:MAG: tRNA (N6-isopentenyl adenosine(37)-C2)-methylthiotransferase MiaB [Clostridiales bacterium]|nr:tRNA (N6-isopentenyl adenosine(37)-C2)-methylthiotransferase MiaB [Clostridiales bacterium]
MAIIKVGKEDLRESDSSMSELSEYFSSLSASKGRSITYNVKTYGCQLNESDSEKLCGMLEQMGLKEASSDETADIIIFNTCAVRENAEDRLFGNLGIVKADKINDKDRIVAVCGCMTMVEQNVEKIKKSFPYVDMVFDPQHLHLFPVYLRDALRNKKQLVNISAEDYIVEDSLVPIARKRRFRALVPIMYGCNNFCTYCIVPYARGRERSRDMEEIMDELKKLASEGYKEVMLLGQNVNSYRSSKGERFPQILEAAAGIEGFSRIRFMSSHPKDVSEEIVDIMASYPNIETHLHLPLQSGSDRILKLMNRPYNREDYLKTAHYFRDKVPHGAISTDIIVGFPGETEEDFLETLKVVKECGFDSAFTFQYSRRPGTKAATMEDQIPHDVVTERFGRLLELQNDLAYKSNLAKVGKTEEILIEGQSSTAPDILTGRTLSNHLVNFTIPDELKDPSKTSDDYEGMLCDVEFTHARPYSVDGKMVRLK